MPFVIGQQAAQLGQNLRFNIKELEKGKKTVIKLWNVARLFDMNGIFFIDYAQEPQFEYSDCWIQAELNKTIDLVTQAFEDYAYAKAKDAIDDLFWSKFADYYIEFVKYRLIGNDETSKYAAQYTLYIVLQAILKMYAPILPFITEELYQNYKDKVKSIHLSAWPMSIAVKSNLDTSDFDQAIQAIDEIKKYKTLMGISLGNQLDEYILKVPLNREKYEDFVKKAIRVTQLRFDSKDVL